MHTPEPWIYTRIESQSATEGFFEPYSPWVAGAGPRIVNINRSICMHADDMRRIVACVNACVGVPNDTLDKIANKQMDGSEFFELAKVQAQRDELLATLTELRDVLKTVPEMQHNKYDSLGVRVNNIIAKCEQK